MVLVPISSWREKNNFQIRNGSMTCISLLFNIYLRYSMVVTVKRCIVNQGMYSFLLLENENSKRLILFSCLTKITVQVLFVFISKF